MEALREEIEQLRQDRAAAFEQISVLQVLQNLTCQLGSELNLEPLLQMILASAVQVMGASAGSLLLLEIALARVVLRPLP